MRELGIKQLEVHVAAVCVAEDAAGLYVLALHRAPSRRLFPGYWEGPGGQVDDGETFPEAAQRHVFEEAGIRARIGEPVTTYVIEPGIESGADKRIPGLRFLAVVDGMPQPAIDPRQHQAARWLAEDQLAAVPWIPGLLPQARAALWAYRLPRGRRNGGARG